MIDVDDDDQDVVLDPDPSPPPAAAPQRDAHGHFATDPDKPPKRGPGRPRKADKPPKATTTSAARGRGRPTKASILSSETDAIAAALGSVLQLPAIPASLVGDAWAERHFLEQGPKLARTLAEASERNLVLRGWLSRLIVGESVAVLVFGIVAYTLPPALYYLAANDNPLREQFHVPPRHAKGVADAAVPEQSATPQPNYGASQPPAA